MMFLGVCAIVSFVLYGSVALYFAQFSCWWMGLIGLMLIMIVAMMYYGYDNYKQLVLHRHLLEMTQAKHDSDEIVMQARHIEECRPWTSFCLVPVATMLVVALIGPGFFLAVIGAGFKSLVGRADN